MTHRKAVVSLQWHLFEGRGALMGRYVVKEPGKRWEKEEKEE